jgi:hypothetical protein
MIHISHTRKLLGITAVVTAGITAGAGVANAVGSDTDSLIVNGDHADFGYEPHWFGSPQFGGDVVFNGNVTASVTGHTFLDNLPGHCARVKVEFLTANGTLLPDLSVRGDEVCDRQFRGGLLKSNEWTRSATDSRIAQVRVKTYFTNFAGEYVLDQTERTVKDNN